MRFIRYFYPVENFNASDPYRRESAEFFVRVSLMVAILGITLGLAHLKNQVLAGVAINFSISFFSLLNLFFFKKILDLRLSANFLMLFCMLFLCAHILTSNIEYYSYHLIWIPCFPLFASVLLTKKETKLWTLILFCIVVSIVMARNLGLDTTLYTVQKTKVAFQVPINITMNLLLIFTLIRNIGKKESFFKAEYDKNQKDTEALKHAITEEVANYSSAMRLILEEVDKLDKDNGINIKQKLTERLDSIDQIVSRANKLTQEGKNGSSLVKTIDLYNCMKEVRRVMQERLDKKNLNLQIQLENHPPRNGYLVQGDPSTLAMPIISTIIANAINHSPVGYRILVQLKSLESSIILEVKDSGNGMTNHFINKLLNPFINEERFEEDGKIMNLASCDKLLQSFGAKMFIDSRAKEIYPDNHGTTVRIHFKSAA